MNMWRTENCRGDPTVQFHTSGAQLDISKLCTASTRNGIPHQYKTGDTQRKEDCRNTAPEQLAIVRARRQLPRQRGNQHHLQAHTHGAESSYILAKGTELLPSVLTSLLLCSCPFCPQVKLLCHSLADCNTEIIGSNIKKLEPEYQ